MRTLGLIFVTFLIAACGGSGGKGGGFVTTCTWNSTSTSSGFCDILLTCKDGMDELSCSVDKGECICLSGPNRTKGNSFTSPGICSAKSDVQVKAYGSNCVASAADDMAMSSGGDMAQQPIPDLTMTDQPPDLTMASGGTLGCYGGGLNCANNCMDAACITACQKKTTVKGWNLFQTVIACVFGGPNGNPKGACPDTNNGVCDQAAGNYDPNACDMCVQASQVKGGACYQALQNCLNDKP